MPEAVDLDRQRVAVAVAVDRPIQVLVLQGAEESFDDAVVCGLLTRVRTCRSSGSSPVNASANTVPRKHGPLSVTTATGAGA
jgi:hypothetical protein